MPNSLSAKKRVRQTITLRARNRWRKRQVKDQVKAFLSAVQARDLKQAESEYRKTAAILDKVAGKGTIHRNNAARHKSRLANRLNDLKRAGSSKR